MHILRRENGNALFLILIGVALFAALSYAITQSSRGGGSIAKEKEMLDMAVVHNYQALVTSAIMRLEFSGCAVVATDTPDSTVFGAATSDEKQCYLYAAEGGAVPYRDLDATLPPACQGIAAAAICETFSGMSLIHAGVASGARIYTTTANSASSNWATAGAVCSSLGSKWRLPTSAEVLLMYNEQSNGAFAGTFPASPDYFTSFSNGIYTEGFRFSGGSAGTAYATKSKAGTGSVRCVYVDS